MKKIVSFLLIIAFTLLGGTAAAAAGNPPTDSYTKQTSNGAVVPIKPIYAAGDYITARSLGLKEPPGTVVDIDCDPEGNVYALTEESSVIVFDGSGKYLNTLKFKNADGEEIDFKGAAGISVISADEIYIADTENGRVLQCGKGTVEKEILVPEDALIPSDFVFRPMKVAKDSQNYIYVISEGSYYGAILYDAEGAFVGFYGANTVKATVLTALANLWDKLTKNDIKRSKKIRTLPYQFTDLCVGKNDFVYTCTGKNADNKTGQLKMLSPGGSNILKNATSVNYGEDDKVVRRGQTVLQNFSNIGTDEEGFIYALDSSFGIIYVYDSESNLITAFGGGNGSGEQKGTFSSACSLAVHGNRLYVADSVQNSVTVFERTEYGEKLFKAQSLTLNSDYRAAAPVWEELHSLDTFNPIIIKGLAKSAYEEGDYDKALSLSKQIADSDTYSLALEKVENSFISENFTWIFIAALLVILLIIAAAVYIAKKHIVLIKNPKIRAAGRAVFHPFISFNDIKYKKLGSLKLAAVITLLFFISSVINVTLSNFRYTSFDSSSYNVLNQLAQTVGLVILWTASNWAVCILFGGIGKVTEVFTVSAYSTLPLIAANILITPITHLIGTGGNTLISGVQALAIILTGIMLCIALMTVHDFTFPRTVLTAALTVVFMILVIFVFFVIGVLLSQTYSFVSDIAIELLRW